MNKMVVNLILILGILTGCSTTKREIVREKMIHPPEHIEILIAVKQNRIIKSQIMDAYITDVVPDLRFSFKGRYMGDLVFVFRSSKFYDSEWLASVPDKVVGKNEINGTFSIEAIRYSRSISNKLSDWSPPPNLIRLQLEFRNKRVVDQNLLRPRVEWGVFHFVSKDSHKKILQLGNQSYSGCIWKGLYGEEGKDVSDGRVIVQLKLINPQCYERKAK